MDMTIEQYVKKRRQTNEVFHKRLMTVLLLSLLVVLGVFWWLKLVGITMAGEAFCGMTEHAHTDTCIEQKLVCGQAENETHVHVEGCYRVTYTCGLEEHIHDVSCYSDTGADLETQKDWEASMAEIPHLPTIADRLVAIAQSQLGYTESTRNYQVDLSGEKHGYQRYGEWYGHPYGDWNAIFIDFCLHYSGVPSDALIYSSGVETLRIEWEKLGVYAPLAAHTPARGDILFFDDNADGKADRVGILSEITNAHYAVIFGDSDDCVQTLTLSKTDPSLLGATVEEEIVLRMASQEELDRVAHVSELIEALPSMEEIGKTLAVYDEIGDTDAYTAYFATAAQDSLNVYALWEDLDIYRPLVKNGSKLEPYASLWMQTVSDELTIKYINKHDASTILVYGSGTVKDVMGTGMSYTYWDLYMVERHADGGYVVSTVNTADVSKLDIALPADGFVILCYTQPWDVSVGDRIDVPFAYKQGSGYNENGFGTLSKVTKNNKLTPIDSADTFDLIDINLFNYGDKINTYYKQDIYYPGFQQEYGASGNSLSSPGLFNFGNNITTDLAAGINGLVSSAPTDSINDLVPSSPANLPLSGVMKFDLSPNGYPVLKHDGAHSELSWLFSEHAPTSTTKLNTQNINGLFRYNAETGEYYFDSRLFNAHYNAEKQIFELYDERLTPNYMMYPFGNFLPFNNINTQATRVIDINRAYFKSQASSAAIKHQNGQSVHITDGGRDMYSYDVLNKSLTKFVELMDGKYPGGFGWEQGLESYFEVADLPPASTPDNGSGAPNPIDGLYNLDYTVPTDFYFGMSMKFDFIMPKDGMTGPDGKQPLVFDFNGDDDVWIYVDGKLYLDLSGIHRHVGGRIDFVNGRVMYYEFNKESGQADKSVDTGIIDPATGKSYRYTNEKGETVYYVPFSYLDQTAAKNGAFNEKGTFQNYTEHTIDFFYMERGSGSSVCNISFNLPLLRKNRISVNKELQGLGGADVSVIGDPDFKFQILKANADGTTTDEPFIGENVPFDIYDSVTYVKLGTGMTGKNGIFTLKADQTAMFADITEDKGNYFVRELLDPTVFEQYGKISVDNKVVTLDTYDDHVIGNTTYKGVDSGIKNINEGNTSFTFTNILDIYEFGALRLQKEFLDYADGIDAKYVTFELFLGDKPVPLGAPYTVTLPDGTKETRTVTEEGFVTFRSDETVCFEKVIAGTQIKLREVSEATAGYHVSYQALSGITLTAYAEGDAEYVSGVIESGTVGVIQIINEREGTKIKLPLRKHLLYPDGTLYSFTFVIEGIDDPQSQKPTGYYQKTAIELREGETDFAFTLNYPQGTTEGTYFYRVYEDRTQSALGGTDPSVYLVEIRVTSDENGNPVCTLISISKDDKAVSTEEPMVFVNRVVRSLTIGKTVTGISPVPSDVFTFTLTASLDGKPLSGSFPAKASDGREWLITLTGGVSTPITLSHGQTVTLTELPYGTEWSVTEAPAPGYQTSYALNQAAATFGSTASGKLTAVGGDHVTFYNMGGYELPSTGSASHLWFIVTGSALMLFSLVIGYIIRHRQERRRGGNGIL